MDGQLNMFFEQKFCQEVNVHFIDDEDRRAFEDIFGIRVNLGENVFVFEGEVSDGANKHVN